VKESYKMVLTFLTDTGEKMQISIPRARTDMGEPAMLNAMNDIIATGIVVSKNGIPVSAVSAELVKTEITDKLA